ncbi:MAG: hypothetical protein ACI8QZ_003604 [Chlamydiales bacterium]|jgi:hypothetical protein
MGTDGIEEISACRPGDRHDQVALFNLCFGKRDGERVLAWRYDQNPHGRPIQLLTRDAGRAVSGYACNPRRALARGAAAATVGQTGDVMTDPGWRGRGLFSDLDRGAMRATAKAGWPAVFGLPNRKSEPLFTGKLGWTAVGRIRPWSFVLAANADARKERQRAGRLASVATPWACWLGKRARRRMATHAAGQLAARPLTRFDDAVDPLWRAVAADYDWMIQRDASYLNWRFIDAPSGRFRALGVFDNDGHMRGYAVVQLPLEEAPVGYVVDLLARDAQASACAMDAALSLLQTEGASIARAWAIDGSSWNRELVGAGFRAPKAADYKVVIAMVHDPEHPLGMAALDPARWYFTDGDRDDELVS